MKEISLAASLRVTPFDPSRPQLAVGDGTTVPTIADVDLSAAAGASLGGGISGATNASPIELTTASAHGLVAGQVVVVAGVGGNTAANGTFEVASVSSSTTLTLLGSVGNGAYSSGGTVKSINKYRALANVAGSAVITGNEIIYKATFYDSNGNFAWNEWAVTTGGFAAKQQDSPPPTLLNHAVPLVSFGTKTPGENWAMTVALGIA